MHEAIANRKPSTGLRALLAMSLLALSACVSTTVREANPVRADYAASELPQESLLNVNIARFDPNIPDDPAERRDNLIFPAVRQSESRLIPSTLRDTLEGTGQWGAVRVVPDPIVSSELLVTGRILQSNGEFLRLDVRAVDATGRVWLDREYSHQAASLSYSDGPANVDPFQSLYNRIANDLVATRARLAQGDLGDIRRVADMRFKAEIAPYAFADYIEESRGRYRLVGLPAQGDPMVRRLDQVRARDNVVIDSLDAHYGAFQTEIDPSYSEWRAASYRESVNLRETERAALSRKLLGAAAVIGGIIGLAGAESQAAATASQVAIFGGGYIFMDGVGKSQSAEMHAESLKELGGSLGRELEPRVVELEGRTVTLSGSAQAQYREWREMLRETYASETGLPVAASDSAGN